MRVIGEERKLALHEKLGLVSKLSFTKTSIANTEKHIATLNAESLRCYEEEIDMRMNKIERDAEEEPRKQTSKQSVHGSAIEQYSLFSDTFAICAIPRKHLRELLPAKRMHDSESESEELPTDAHSFPVVANLARFDYVSPLLSFRSYRLSPYFRAQQHEISASTFSHRIDSSTPLCRYELAGKCSIEDCAMQHKDDYTPKPEALLDELASYYPDSHTKTELIPVLKKTLQFESREKVCAMLVDRLNKVNPTHPTYIRTRQSHAENSSSSSSMLIAPTLDGFSQRPADFVGDARYWDHGHDQDFEQFQSAKAKDSLFWLQYASSAIEAQGTEAALSILSRGLEHNRRSSDLWRAFLTLHTAEKISQEELDLITKDALRYLPFDVEVRLIYIKNCSSPLIQDRLFDAALAEWMTNPQSAEAIQGNPSPLLGFVFEMAQFLIDSGNSERIDSLFGRFILVPGAFDLNQTDVLHSINLSDADMDAVVLCYAYLLAFRSLPDRALFRALKNSSSSAARCLFDWSTFQPDAVTTARVRNVFLSSNTNSARVLLNRLAMELRCGQKENISELSEKLLQLAGHPPVNQNATDYFFALRLIGETHSRGMKFFDSSFAER
jgi:hypothetical protein